MRFYLYLCTQKNKVINNLNITNMAQEKTIIGRFNIPDCEHRGDIEWGRNVVTNRLGGKVMITREYWDKRDCGTAYIEFCFPLSKLAAVDKEIGQDTSFCYVNININDYIQMGGSESLCGCNNKVSAKELRELCKRCDYSKGFEKRIAVKLFFQHGHITPEDVTEKALEALGKSARILGYSCSRVDGNLFTDVVFSVNVNDIDGKKFEGFGDYCLGHRGWLSQNHIYGEMSIQHEVKQSLMTYDRFKDIIKSVAAKKDIIFMTRSCDKISLPYEEYMQDGHVKSSVERDGKEYFINVYGKKC